MMTEPLRATGADSPDAAGTAPAVAPAPSATPGPPVRPRMLRPGDTVRLVSPAGPPDREAVKRGEALFTGWGLRVEYAPHALDSYGYLAAPDADRLADLNDALADPSVRGVICTRGGYGVQRILDGIDATAVREDPKLVVGYSDITGLQVWLWRHARLATVHGPMATWRPDRTGPASAESLRGALLTTDQITVSRDPAQPAGDVEVPGTATGILLGGNVSLLAAAVGCGELPGLHGAIVFLEDVGEDPYRLDRMLTQLRRSGAFDGVRGFALGQWDGCAATPGTWSVGEMLADRLGDLGVPVLSGLPVGHGAGQRTIPLGVPASIDTAAGTLTAEPAVTA